MFLFFCILFTFFRLPSFGESQRIGRRAEVGICIKTLESGKSKIDCLKGTKNYCCGNSTHQHCCTSDEFANQHRALLIAIIIMIFLSGALFFLLITCGFTAFMLSRGIQTDDELKEEGKKITKLRETLKASKKASVLQDVSKSDKKIIAKDHKVAKSASKTINPKNLKTDLVSTKQTATNNKN